MKKVVFAVIILLLLLTTSAFAKTTTTFTFVVERSIAGEKQQYEGSFEVALNFSSSPKGKQISFGTYWNEKRNKWVITVTEGAEYLEKFNDISVDSYNLDLSNLCWSYTFKGNEKNLKKLTIPSTKIATDKDYTLWTYMFNSKGEIVYFHSEVVGAYGTFKRTYNWNFFKFPDKPKFSIGGLGLSPSIICMLVEHVYEPSDGKYYPPVDDSWISRLTNVDVSGGILITKNLAAILNGQETLILPSADKDIVVPLKNISIEADTIVPVEEITVILKE